MTALAARPMLLPLLLVCALGAGCRKDDTPPAKDLLGSGATATVVGTEPEPHRMGATAHARDYTLEVLNVRECAVEPHFAPPPGSKKLGVEVSLAGTSDRVVPVNPFYATVVAAGGERYGATLAGCTPALRSGRISQGKQARGWLSFDVPAGLGRFELSYEPVVVGVGPERLRFDLGG